MGTICDGALEVGLSRFRTCMLDFLLYIMANQLVVSWTVPVSATMFSPFLIYVQAGNGQDLLGHLV